jgi:hypothetical protein
MPVIAVVAAAVVVAVAADSHAIVAHSRGVAVVSARDKMKTDI